MRKITDRQEQSVRNLIARGYRYREIAERLHISEDMVYGVAKRDGVRRNHPWTDEEIRFLKENYRELGPTGCARVLRDTHPNSSAVCRKARELGLTGMRGR